ncbi:hypothetical protein V8F06_006868 [Rhypophila decipiens]
MTKAKNVLPFYSYILGLSYRSSIASCQQVSPNCSREYQDDSRNLARRLQRPRCVHVYIPGSAKTRRGKQPRARRQPQKAASVSFAGCYHQLADPRARGRAGFRAGIGTPSPTPSSQDGLSQNSKPTTNNDNAERDETDRTICYGALCDVRACFESKKANRMIAASRRFSLFNIVRSCGIYTLSTQSDTIVAHLDLATGHTLKGLEGFTTGFQRRRRLYGAFRRPEGGYLPVY